jgi:diacylglycerol O-acyltransferase
MPGSTMAPADVAWLRMERPTNPMTITGVMTTATPMDRAALERLITERLLPFRRFRQRVADPHGARPRWEDDPHFDVAHHVIPFNLPDPADKAVLEEAVSSLMSTPLTFEKPPWTFHLVEHFGTGSALIIRLHHCIADGIALMRVLLSIADEAFSAAAIPDGRRPRRPLGQRLAGTLRGAAAETADLLTHPSHLADRARQGGRGAAALAALLAMAPDSDTVFKGPATPAKRAAWTRPLDLDTIRGVASAHGAKVNDVLLAAAAGALRRYLAARGEPTAGVEVRAAVPFNVRPAERALELGNRFALVFLALPVGMEAPRARLAALKERMDVIKNSAEPAVVFGILQSIGRAPKWAHRMVVKMFSEKCSAVMTNVPGPAEPLHLLGRRIDGLMFWVPQAGDIGLGLSILSFDGRVLVGVASDAGRIADPGALTAAFEAEFDALTAGVAAPA